jgi:hypothetical protein
MDDASPVGTEPGLAQVDPPAGAGPAEPGAAPAEPPRGFWGWLRHAFAIEKYDESSLEPDDKAALQRFAERLHEKRMTAAAILWMQSNRHMNFLGSQALVVAQPVFELTHPLLNAALRNFGLNIPPEDYPHLVSAFEKRYSVEYLLQRLEALLAEQPAA